jgi:hypothetical protein
MRLRALYLIGALAMAAVPHAAGAAPSPAAYSPGANAQQAAPADECGPGWYWEGAGYVDHGKWRPAHCAPSEMG